MAKVILGQQCVFVNCSFLICSVKAMVPALLGLLRGLLETHK